MKRIAPLTALASSVLLLGSCHVNNGKLDMSWVGDRIHEAQNDEVMVEGSTSAGPSIAVNTPAAAPAAAPAAPMAAAPATPAAAKGGTYTVKPGDTLRGIAIARHSSTAAIAAANHITNPDKLSVGQVLRIPAVSGAAAKATAPRKATVPASRYAVRQGDTLSGISRRTGVPVQQLMRANKMTTPNLRAGSTITIPKH
ncbi:MAG: LysM peptidoglycan-binding domain-containing protein [Akkermansia sp.]|nr:LysM peptidoglycan-binding domain-containing protein [Akkermansia sp.]